MLLRCWRGSTVEGTGRLLSAVDFSAVPDSNDDNKDFFTTHLVEDPVVADADSVPVSASETARLWRKRVLSKQLNSCIDSQKLCFVDVTKSLERRSSESNSEQWGHKPSSSRTSSHGMCGDESARASSKAFRSSMSSQASWSC